ncbi:unnamed protein product [Notodromas monacha]|uniref:Late endosomal/lysosomal adaptor and MAPK and MTOR activator 4 n=1 Tax=Notodromas monacha TaxID=399045 RepID=A0A7R9BQX8_9CRUS|nr:unnamed protein product [Notodromas monacha]CAG0918538.1 unnamed protein product [Notodromas monacha]
MIPSLEQIPSQVGYMVLSLDGAILNSGGQLSNLENFAEKILKLLPACWDLVETTGCPETIQTISVNYSGYSYIIAKSNNRLHVVKRVF